jgi:hypothetical protein
MNLRCGFSLAAVAFCVGASALADASSHIPAAAEPTIRCIHRALKSDRAVQSVDLYSIDESRFAVEFGFRNKTGRVVVSDIELLIDAERSVTEGGPVTETNLIPRGISEETAAEAGDLETRLDLRSKCHFDTALDDLYPGPTARAGWLRIGWPKE